MNTEPIKTSLVALHHDEPQIVRRIETALHEVGVGLAALASLGHMYHLADGQPPQGDEWPKLLFHATDAPAGRLIYNPDEASALGPGWAETLQDAQQKAGIAAQFAGRAGVGSQALPTTLVAPQTEDERIAERTRLRDEARANLINQSTQEGHSDAPQE